MGAGVSGWELARAVAVAGELGVVAGTALPTIMARRLQNGDSGGHMRRALRAFPLRDVAERLISRFWIDGGKAAESPFRGHPLPGTKPSRALLELTVAANFAEIFLAREGHSGVIGLNLLEKIQLPTLASLYGAMLAGVDYVLMGAGIPRSIPGIIDQFAIGGSAKMKIEVQGQPADQSTASHFDPTEFLGQAAPQLKRPRFIAIVSSAALATTLARKANGKVDGFVVEGPTAGGHNAPPRGPMQLSSDGQPVYGPRDVPEIDKIRSLGLPFWLAGSFGRPGKLREARELGANGIQVATPFAFCNESGIRSDLKAAAINASRDGNIRVHTDPLASPTGFPFKIVKLAGTLGAESTSRPRTKTCDLGYLRRAYLRDDGTIGYRCPAEPEQDFLRKGGDSAETTGRQCVCNGLLATIGLAQIQADGTPEPPLVTAGDDARLLHQFLSPGMSSYSAHDVIQRLRC